MATGIGHIGRWFYQAEHVLRRSKIIYSTGIRNTLSSIEATSIRDRTGIIWAIALPVENLLEPVDGRDCTGGIF
jgi:hypothetical protein